MKIAIVLNGISRKKKFFYREILPKLQQHFAITVYETRHAQHAYALAGNASAECDVILAAGGDGTLHQCLNGLMTAATNGIQLPALGVIPLGTANDFARTCGIMTCDHMLKLLLEHNPKPTDVGLIQYRDDAGKSASRYFINACSLGMGPAVVQRLQRSKRRLGARLTYLLSIIPTFLFPQA